MIIIKEAKGNYLSKELFSLFSSIIKGSLKSQSPSSLVCFGFKDFKLNTRISGFSKPHARRLLFELISTELRLQENNKYKY